MKASRDSKIFIDLSFLSPEEEAVIQKVLLRDEDLKRLETGRVRKLKNSVFDVKQLKVLSGEWFEELKSKRHGRQPLASAVVRSSMRWKKTTGHKPNPFPKSVLEQNDEEMAETRPGVSVDPRSIHPALSVEICQELRDEDIIVKEAPGANLNDPDRLIIRARHQSAATPEESPPSYIVSINREPKLESKGVITCEDPGRSPSQINQTNIYVETETPELKRRQNSAELKDGNMGGKTYEIRSFSKALENSHWGEAKQLDAEALPNNTIPEAAPDTMISSNKSTDVMKKQRDGDDLNKTILDQSVSKNSIPKNQSGEETIRRASPTRTDELSMDLNVKESPDVLLDLQTGPVHNFKTPKHANLDPNSVKKGHAIEEIIVTDIKQASPTRTDELNLDLNAREDPDVLLDLQAGPVYDPKKLKQESMDLKPVEPIQKKRTIKKITGTDFRQASDEFTMDLNASEDPDALQDLQTGLVHDQKFSDPVKKIKSGKEIIAADIRQDSPTRVDEINAKKDPHVRLDRQTELIPELNPTAPKQKVKTTEKIEVTKFRQSSPTRMDELSVDLTIKEDPDFLNLQMRPVPDQDPVDPVQKKKAGVETVNHSAYDLKHLEDVQLDQTVLVEKKRGRITESVVKSEIPGETLDLDVKLRDPADADKKRSVSKETDKEFIAKVEDGGGAKEDGRSESEILASVYARAIRAKPKTKDEEGLIPSVVIMPESEEPKKIKSVKNAISALEAPGNGDTWEGELDSDSEEESSASSHEFDLSGKKIFSTSTLSVTERTGSMLSVYSDAGDFGNVTVQGSVEFAIMYSPLGELVIMVEQCQDLAFANPRKQRTDPYIKTYLYPDKRSKRKTSIKKNTLNPIYVESLRYKVKREDLPARTLNLSVWHNDPRGRNVFLGQVVLNLRHWDWKHEALTWYILQPKSKDNQETQEYNGVLRVSLKYVLPESAGGSSLSKATGEIHIWLHEARQLRRLKTQGVDSFVKCYMLPDTSKKSRHKTRVVKRSQDPVYNHTMVYDGFRAGEVGEACCELTVWDSNKLSNQFLGGVRLSLGTGQSYGKKVDWMDSEDKETEIWKRMMENPDSWVEAELPLRSSMTPRK